MNPEDVGRILDEIGERIGPAGQYAWGLSVRQVVMEGFIWIALGLVCVAGAVAVKVVANRYNRKQAEARASGSYSYASDTDGIEWMGVITLLVLAAPCFALGFLNLANPEFGAMTRLLERIVP